MDIANVNPVDSTPEEILAEIIEKPGPRWEETEAALDRRGSSLPLFHRAVWARANAASGTHGSLIAIPSGGETCRSAFAFEIHRSRALPGHRLLSVRHLGLGCGGLDEFALDEGLALLTIRAQADKFVLRVTIDTFALDPESRERIYETLWRHGFRRVPTTRTYERTLLVDLTADEDAILAGFSRSARRNIRSVAKFPAVITTAESTSLADRLQELDDETRRRTGGEQRALDWASIIRMSAAAPQLSRIAILSRTDQTYPKSVLAFAWGCMHGAVAEYSESGSTRIDDLKVPTSYALLWDLIRWARRYTSRNASSKSGSSGSWSRIRRGRQQPA